MPYDSSTLKPLGWNSHWEEQFRALNETELQPARVALEDKHRYGLLTGEYDEGMLSAVIPGKLLHKAASNAALPKVGDWVAVSMLANEKKGVIQQILPRKSTLSRKVPGRQTIEQVLATNIDSVFIVQALDATFNPNLLHRHLAMVFESGAKPIVLLNKSDLCDNLDEKLSLARQAAGDTPVFPVSAKCGDAVEEVAHLLSPGQTFVLIGSSGVGKSTLINRLYGEEIQPTIEVRESDSKGRHTTSCRELILLPQGGIVIDTPGTREFHLWHGGSGLQESFADVEDIAVHCHFRDCGHTVEKRCAVLESVASGQITRERYESFLKLKKENARLEEAQNHRAQTERKRLTKIAHKAFYKLKNESDSIP